MDIICTSETTILLVPAEFVPSTDEVIVLVDGKMTWGHNQTSNTTEIYNVLDYREHYITVHTPTGTLSATLEGIYRRTPSYFEWELRDIRWIGNIDRMLSGQFGIGFMVFPDSATVFVAERLVPYHVFIDIYWKAHSQAKMELWDSVSRTTIEWRREQILKQMVHAKGEHETHPNT